MASFLKANDLLADLEKGYVNDPIDKGGETFCGISRRFHPSWLGWPIVDSYKETKSGTPFPEVLMFDVGLMEMVDAFYKERYWDCFVLDEFPQDLAEAIFQMGVNLGIYRTTTFIQRAVNVLNKQGRLFSDLKVDGVFGPRTFGAMRGTLNHKEDGDRVLKTILTSLQTVHYVEVMEKSDEQERFAWGWVRRASM